VTVGLFVIAPVDAWPFQLTLAKFDVIRATDCAVMIFG
jgi:hypothetical protein